MSAVETLIQEAQDFTLEVEAQPEQRQPIVACMVVLGFPPAREQETLEDWLYPYRITPDAVERLVRVGAVYYEIPAEPRYAQSAPRRHYFREQMKALYGSGPVEEASDNMAGLVGNSVTPVVADPYSEFQHLQIYRNPPFQLSDDDFQRLLERIAMPDEDWRKDD